MSKAKASSDSRDRGVQVFSFENAARYACDLELSSLELWLRRELTILRLGWGG